ncbi:hypothetical protein CCY99_08745 [Helicobacter sp. 16-1353]|uniref:CinA family protein n=1 Tax=Helicobacter sp. 16-1353 TaxID=2004996 RepID=UPI000DCDDF48|nr:CinA family protein [Helicobacter sp. 16-1353]RAX51637.1 hypothetical protein CCY99_08745 [Helicobacter sp. 16-1353]
MKKINLNSKKQDKDLSKIIIETLIQRKQTLSIAESCTGGFLSYQFTKIIGASNVFIGSVISYHNDAKIKILNVKEESIDKYTPYSNEVVNEMLNGIMSLTNSTYAIATSGIAGPSGGDKINPIGSVYIGLKKNNGETRIIKTIFDGNREEIQVKSSLHALRLLIAFIS